MVLTFRDKEINAKERLSLTDAISFVDSVAGNLVSLEYGSYSPTFYKIGLISNFITYYTEMVLPTLDEIYDNIDVYIKLLDDAKYTNDFNRLQFEDLLADIDKSIEFKKQQLLTNNDNSVSEYVKELIKEQIETVKLNKQVLQQTAEMNKNYGKDDLNNFATAITNFNSNFENPEFQKNLVNVLAKFQPKKPQDRKKSTKKVG